MLQAQASDQKVPGDQTPTDFRPQFSEQMPAIQNQRSVEFGLLAKAVREGKVDLSAVEPRLRSMLTDADRTGNAALDREKRELQNIDPERYTKALDNVRDTRLELNQTITSNVSGEDRSYARLAAEQYMAQSGRQSPRADAAGSLR